MLTRYQDNFRLPCFSTFLESMRNELLNGKGFILFKGFPVEKWGNHKSAIAYMGLGTYLGYFVSQNGKGHVLGHVKDLGDDAKQIDKVRIYRTNARYFSHWSKRLLPYDPPYDPRLILRQSILPCRRLGSGGPSLHRASSGRRRVGHCFRAPCLQCLEQRKTRCTQDLDGTNMVFRSQRRSQQRRGPLYPYQRFVS